MTYQDSKMVPKRFEFETDEISHKWNLIIQYIERLKALQVIVVIVGILFYKVTNNPLLHRYKA